MKRQRPFRIHLGLKWVGLIFLLLLTVPFSLPSKKGTAGEKFTIGQVEEVVLLPWGVRLPARIDTGASISSLDARELKVNNNVAEFNLPRKYGGLKLRLSVVEWQDVRGADFKERRPVVEMMLCMGPKLIRTRMTLNDRSKASYPLIVGRNILKDNFVVDCVQSNCLPPSCPEGQTP